MKELSVGREEVEWGIGMGMEFRDGVWGVCVISGLGDCLVDGLGVFLGSWSYLTHQWYVLVSGSGCRHMDA